MGEIAIHEATVKVSEDARMIQTLIDGGMIKRTRAKEQIGQLRADFRLDKGETESIVLAREMGAICGTDDGPAIRCCRVLGIPFTSTIGLLIRLSEIGLIENELALELLAKLERIGRYNGRILEDAKRKIRAARH